MVTGTRADFGLLRWLIDALERDDRTQPSVIATGMHLSPVFGHTLDDVQAATPVVATVELLLSSDSPVGTAKSVGVGVISFADVLDRLRPDVVVVLGDRFEVLAAAQAALMLGIPLAHVHGGEVTTGAFDDAIRHAVSKMAHLHFVAAEPYRRRLLQMGERPDRVWTVGAPGLDLLDAMPLLSREALAAALDVDLGVPLLAVAYHPVTTDVDPVGGVEAVLTALQTTIAAAPDATVIITMPNADPGGLGLMARLRSWADAHPAVHTFTSLGSARYLSLLAVADVVVGNSSSGIIEAPALGTPTVNVGPRQDGRLRAASITDCPADAAAVAAAITDALAQLPRAPDPASLPYGGGGASARMAEILATVPLDDLLAKPFVDLPVGGLP